MYYPTRFLHHHPYPHQKIISPAISSKICLNYGDLNNNIDSNKYLKCLKMGHFIDILKKTIHSIIKRDKIAQLANKDIVKDIYQHKLLKSMKSVGSLSTSGINLMRMVTWQINMTGLVLWGLIRRSCFKICLIHSQNFFHQLL